MVNSSQLMHLPSQGLGAPRFISRVRSMQAASLPKGPENHSRSCAIGVSDRVYISTHVCASWSTVVSLRLA